MSTELIAKQDQIPQQYKYRTFVNSLADPWGGRQGRILPLSAIFFIFAHFLWEGSGIGHSRPRLWGWRPYLANPGSTTQFKPRLKSDIKLVELWWGSASLPLWILHKSYKYAGHKFFAMCEFTTLSTFISTLSDLEIKIKFTSDRFKPNSVQNVAPNVLKTFWHLRHFTTENVQM